MTPAAHCAVLVCICPTCGSGTLCGLSSCTRHRAGLHHCCCVHTGPITALCTLQHDGRAVELCARTHSCTCCCPATAHTQVAAAVKALSVDEILRYEQDGCVTLEGHTLGQGDIKVRSWAGVPHPAAVTLCSCGRHPSSIRYTTTTFDRSLLLLPLLLLLCPPTHACNQVTRTFRPPAGVPPGEVDAAGDGEVLVVLELLLDGELVEQGMAREVVNRHVCCALT
jgi:hypothetical protein